MGSRGESVTSSSSMSEEFNSFFTSVFNEEGTGDTPEAEWMYQGKREERLCELEITEGRVMKELEKLRDDKAAGADDLMPRYLNSIKDYISYPLTVLFQKILEQEDVPDDWRDANVVPIFKGGNRSNASNYRPVSLTSQISKIFESIARDEMVNFFEKHKVIRNTQHGFRKGKSCLTNLLVFLDRLTRYMDEGASMDVIFLDLAKAFDKVPHRRLIQKLEKHGIGGKLKRVIENWLANRRQRVCIRGTMSGWRRVLSGVPQGSVLGALLFLVYINDLDSGLMNEILKFADDTKLFGRVEEDRDREQLQSDLDTIGEWAEKWKMEFNVGKCKLMHIGRQNRKYSYNMGGILIQEVTAEKDLGIIITDDGKSSGHCLYVYNKAIRILGMINRTISYKEKGIMVQLYKSLVRPHLEYCLSAWSPHYVKDKQLLERVQHRFTRMFKELRDKDYNERLRYLNLWTLEERRNRQDLIELFKMYKGISGLDIKELFEFDSNVKGTRGHTAKLTVKGSIRDTRKFFFPTGL